ncbi:hypothetical protein BDA99DRAFT_509188 [Phascolomyces articulosus]|uniref:Rho-GAP domain-containing protein n=1 Tax=Phascolomyces articulosus TaxID=60185 RepID=A0AAD5PED7_9FUNG|nr:hypothetical protein BDA99DRAFT_509188 [Phascolomyces articulosus]
MHHHPFYTSFWSPNASQNGIPDFSHGLNVLHQKLQQSIEENQVVAHFLRKRATVEQVYAEQLASLDENHNNNDNTNGKAFDRDIGAGLKKCFEVVRCESTESSKTHEQRANNLIEQVLDPLGRFTKRYERIVTRTKKQMDDQIALFAESFKMLDQSSLLYTEKCRTVQSLCPEYKHPNNPLWIHDWMFTRIQLCRLLEQLDHNNNNNEMMTGQQILDRIMKQQQAMSYNINQEQQQQQQDEISSRHSNVSGWSIATTDLGPRFDEPEKDSETFCQALVDQGYLKPSTTTTETANEFSRHTQYSIEYPDIGIPGATYSEYLTEQSKSFDSSPGGVGSLFGRWGRSNNSTSGEACHRAIHEMDQADKIYKNCVKEVDKVRMETEEELFSHYEEMESLELERIQTIKQSFVSTAAILSNSIPYYKELYDRMMLYQETLKPDKDVQFIVEQYHTGRFCPRPPLYVNYFHGSAMDQVFGVPLEEYAQIHKMVVPPLISQGLSAIESSFSQIYKEERTKMWTSEIQLDQAHEARERLNIPSLSLILMNQNLERYDVMVLASLIRLYLMELPECLLTFELYDPIKLLYANQHLGDVSRLSSISKLLTTLPPSNFYTLKELLEHFHRLLAKSDNDESDREEILHELSSRFCHVLIRPQVERTLNSHDRHPYRLIRDLISNVDTVFSNDAIKSHEEFANRRIIVATSNNKSSATSTNNSSVKEPSLEGSSAASTASSIASTQLGTPTRESIHSGNNPTEQQQQQKDKVVENDVVTHQDQQINNGRSPQHEFLSSSPPQRRRTLLSFMRRSSSTSTAELARSATMSAASPHRPIPVPSSSTLFEDPDETPFPPRQGRASAEPPRQPRGSFTTELPGRRRLSEEPTPTFSKSKPNISNIIIPNNNDNALLDRKITDSPSLVQLDINEPRGPTPPPKENYTTDVTRDNDETKQARHSRASSFGGSLDSFFKDEDF